VLFLLVARTRPPAVAGLFTLAMSYALLLEAISQLGFDQLLIRDVARDRSRTQAEFNSLLTMRLTVQTIAVAAFAGLMSIGQFYDAETRQLIMMMALIALPDAVIDMCQALFVVTDRLPFPTIISIIGAIARIGLGFLVLRLNGELFYLAGAMLLASTIQMVFNVWLVKHHGLSVRLAFSGLQWRHTMAQALPFGVVQLLVAIEAYSGVILLSRVASDTALGYYGAANTLLAALLLLPNAIQVAVFPRMAEVYSSMRSNFAAFYTRIYRYLGMMGGGTVIGVILMAEWVVVLVYGPAYRPAAVLLQILSGVLLVSFLNIPNVRTLVIAGQQRMMAQLLAVSVTLNVALTILLIPAIGVLGVPVARVTSMAVFWTMSHIYVNRRIVASSLRRILWRPAVAALCVLVVTSVLSGISAWLQTMIGLGVYTLLILVLGGLSQEERQRVKTLLRRMLASQELHLN
jgi:O-antigen/teichoic acid export membrane protein